jgi:hypothetical protein
VGLLVRLRGLSKEKTVDEANQMQVLLERIANAIAGIPHVTTEISHPASEQSGALPTLKVKLNAAGLGRDAFEVSLKLRNGEPRLWVNEKSLPSDVLLITAINLNQQLADTVGKRLREVLSGDD